MKAVVLSLIFAPSLAFAGVVIRPSVNEGFYVCNAGISHVVATGKSCVSQTTGLVCSMETDTSCVCSDASLGQDVLAASWDDLTVAEGSSLRSRSNVLNSNQTGTYSSLFSDINAWNNNVTAIEVNTSSETYGASYFVDFCYEGPVENLKKKNGKPIDQSEGIYTITADVTAQNLGSGYLYQQDSNLGMTLTVNCDLRNVGKYQDARPASLLAPAGNAMESDVNFATSGYPRSSTLSMSQRLNSKTNLVPRFCVVRATFSEMSNSNALKVRPNNVSPTEFTVDLDISNGSAF